MAKLVMKYRWWALWFVLAHPLIYLVCLVTPIWVLGPAAVAVAIALLALVPVWLICVILGV